MQPNPFKKLLLPSAGILAIDAGAGHVAGAQLARESGGRLRLQHFAIVGHEPDPTTAARWPEFLGGALTDISRQGKLRGECRLAPPGHCTLLKFVRTPAMEKSGRGRIVDFEAQQNIPCPLDEVVWDHLCVADDGRELELLLAAVKHDVIGPACAALSAAGFPAAQVVPPGIALWHAFRYNYPDVRDGALVVNIGARSTQLVLVWDGRMLARCVAYGGNALTQAVADELRLDFAPAEELKRIVLSGGADMPESQVAIVHQAATRFINRLQFEIMRSMAGAPVQPAALFLTGGGSLLPELPAVLSTALAVRVERYDPLRRVEIASALRAAGTVTAGTFPPELTGLAAGPGPGEPQALNLLPPTLTRDRTTRRKQPYLLATALLIAAAPAPVAWHYHLLAARTEGNVMSLERELGPLEALVTRNENNLARLERIRTRITALETVVAMKSSWAAFLGDLQERLDEAGDVWLEKLQTLPARPSGEKGKAPALPRRLAVRGRLLDWSNPVSKVSPDSYRRVKALLQAFGESEFIAAVEEERFDNAEPGILRFDCTLVLNPKMPL